MNLNDLRNLDVSDIGSWPIPMKLLLAAIICVAILGLGYWYWIEDDRQSLAGEEKTELELRETFLKKKALAVNLSAYKLQMKEMEESFGVMLRQLPNKTEIPELLIDITQAGIGRGLQFVLFKPQKENVADFYAILPIDIKIIGNYHDLGEFVSDLAALPRIVSLGDISIAPTGKNRPGKLLMTATAMTYRYLEEEEIQAQRNAKKNKKSRRRR